MKVFILSWNTQSVRYKTNPLRNLPHLLSDYDLVVIGLQEDAIKDSLLFADGGLVQEMLKDEFDFLKLESLSGWGATTYKAFKKEWAYCPRGLRLAIFKHKTADIHITEINTKKIVAPGIRDWITCGKGGVAINLITNYGTITFLNIHLPFDSKSLVGDRSKAVLWQSYCLRKIHEETVSEFNPDYIYTFGDLNFRVQLRTEIGATDVKKRLLADKDYLLELLREADELRLLLTYSTVEMPPFKEGINNCGPRFLPTCKMLQGRHGIEYLLGNKDHRVPSWCDRILYLGNTKCIMYNRWEDGDMKLSDHASVIAGFEHF